MHQCLASIVCEQKIHGQQAAQYLKGANDGISSHNTISMPSDGITSYVNRMIDLPVPPPTCAESEYLSNADAACGNDEFEEVGHIEEASKHIPLIFQDDDGPGNNELDATAHVCLTKDGLPSFSSDQIHDYVYRDAGLSNVHVCFYDFVHCYKKVRLCNSTGHFKQEGHLSRHCLQAPHPQAQTHFLIQMIEPALNRPAREIVPRVLGCSIPCCEHNDTYYATFMLAHFLPFSAANTICTNGQSVIEFFDMAQFSTHSLTIMKNWDSIHECEDEQDAEHLRKRQSKINKSKNICKALQTHLPDDYFNSPDVYAVVDVGHSLEDLDPATAYMWAALAGANWLTVSAQDHISTESDNIDGTRLYNNMLPHPIGTYSDQLTFWECQIKIQSNEIAATHRTQSNVPHHTAAMNAPLTIQGVPLHTMLHIDEPSGAPQTLLNMKPADDLKSFNEHVAHIATTQGLNVQQRIAFEICASKFHELLENQSEDATTYHPLWMFLTGPGGTRKTYVVNCLKILMQEYGQAHWIRFLAPMGSATNLIGGQTIHSGIGLRVAVRCGERGDDCNWDLHTSISPQKKTIWQPNGKMSTLF